MACSRGLLFPIEVGFRLPERSLDIKKGLLLPMPVKAPTGGGVKTGRPERTPVVMGGVSTENSAVLKPSLDWYF
jgi:hypothetical protein